MELYPAIDLYQGKAVRLFRGDYDNMTVYSHCPEEIARDFAAAGAGRIHLVDLEGAKSGRPENLAAISKILAATSAKVQVGGGIRDLDTVARYLDSGISRVILGTAAVTDPGFLEAALSRYGEAIAVGVDIKDGFVAIKGWTETSTQSAEGFFGKMEAMGVKTVICTDISRDGPWRAPTGSCTDSWPSDTGWISSPPAACPAWRTWRPLRKWDFTGPSSEKPITLGRLT